MLFLLVITGRLCAKAELSSRFLQLQAAQKDLPGLHEDIAAGRFGGLKAWLNEKIHASGSLHPSGDALMVAATGSPLDPSIFLKYLTDKYSALYKL